MELKEKQRRLETLQKNMNETVTRLRRYTVDKRLLKVDEMSGKLPMPPTAKVEPVLLPEQSTMTIRDYAEVIWEYWLDVHEKIEQLPADFSDADLIRFERSHLEIDHYVDLIQRELISNGSCNAGKRVIGGLVITMVVLVFVYLRLHIVYPPESTSWDFEPWSEWGPMKYGEVIFWGMFGCLCSLLFTASYYLMRRDFDPWYQGWYIATFIRSLFFTLILMMIVLEFIEWYGEDKSWIRNYILEEGNKFYFIVFMSFCLGLASDTTSTIMRELSAGVTEIVSNAISKVSTKLKGAISDTSTSTKH